LLWQLPRGGYSVPFQIVRLGRHVIVPHQDDSPRSSLELCFCSQSLRFSFRTWLITSTKQFGFTQGGPLKRTSIVAAVIVLCTPSVWAAEKSITLDVPGMSCPTCPVTLKKSLLKENGVSGVTVQYEKKQLVVRYDDAKTTPTAITKATGAVGFPSQVAGR
jgi:mercuric ion binding protein